MKHCTACDKDKDESQYNKNKAKKDGLSSLCRECQRQKTAEYYAKNRDYHKAYVGKMKERIKQDTRQKMWDYLSCHPCVDCDCANPIVLDFDHVRGTKKYNVSMMIDWTFSWEKIMLEIEKCEVRCANCHRIKTHKDNNSYKHKFSSRVCSSKDRMASS